MKMSLQQKRTGNQIFKVELALIFQTVYLETPCKPTPPMPLCPICFPAPSVAGTNNNSNPSCRKADRQRCGVLHVPAETLRSNGQFHSLPLSASGTDTWLTMRKKSLPVEMLTGFFCVVCSATGRCAHEFEFAPSFLERLSTRARMSAVFQTVVRNPNLIGLGYRPDLHPAHHALRLMGMRASTCGRRRKPLDWKAAILVLSEGLFGFELSGVIV